MKGLVGHFLLAMLLLLPFGIKAQEADSGFGGWHWQEVSHKFGDSKWSGGIYFEHENYQYQRLDMWFLSSGVRYNIPPWLKLGVSYEYLKIPTTYGHRGIFDVGYFV